VFQGSSVTAVNNSATHSIRKNLPLRSALSHKFQMSAAEKYEWLANQRIRGDFSARRSLSRFASRLGSRVRDIWF